MYVGTYNRLGVSIYATPREVIRAGAKKLTAEAFKPENRKARHAFWRELLAAHKSARELARAFRL